LQPPFPYDEEALIRALAAGDRTAYTHLYSGYLQGLQKYVFLFTGNKEVAEEIVQDVFLKIWEKRSRLGELQSFKAYLFRAAKNQLLNHIRREQVRTKAFSYLRLLSEGSPNGHDTLHQFDYRTTTGLLRKAIEGLPKRRKQVFLLSTEEGLTLDEIALRMAISRNVVKKQLYGAYDSIRTYLIEHGELSAWLILLTGLVQA